MGVFGKLAFWKKKDDFDLGKDFGADLGLGPPGKGPDMGIGSAGGGHDLGLPPQQGTGRDLGLGQPGNLGMPDDIGFGSMGKQQPPGQPAPMQQPFGAPVQPAAPTQKDYAKDKFEVVSAKLDSIRYTLESINQRLTNIERVAYGEHEHSTKKRW